MNAMQLLSLNVGKPIVIDYNGKPVETGIYKQPTEHAVYLSAVQLEGDGQADRVNHGGEDKALCVYSAGRYGYWRERLNLELPYGAFGENFTVSGMLEQEVHIGDIFQLGETVVQISQPRQPCFKLGKKHNEPTLPMQVQETGYSGYYFRVLETGYVQQGQSFKLVQRDAAGISIAEANRVKYHDKRDWDAINALLSVEALSDSWRASLQKRLDERDKQG
ncbi:6-N-hydroxylaminopurine resistance protein [Paenibacillus konkukensis]|uniref:6-N-hydroxylaminopurine resistance protein n=1 Tax=Paenibacillus konkukensis TaxID=2020716 RepID=A0ABY4RPY8_9BACL|nr:6-N-hydroxylaminopurine resistance protein [Paenibacillus konkukensis]